MFLRYRHNDLPPKEPTSVLNMDITDQGEDQCLALAMLRYH